MKILGKFLKIIFVVMAIIYLLPLLLIFTNSFMSSREISRHYNMTGGNFPGKNDYASFRLIPELATLSQYRELLLETPVYLQMFWNSCKIVGPLVLGNLAVSVMAAYGFTVLRFRGKDALFFLYIIVMLLPLQVCLMPNFIMAEWLNISESYLAIILPGIFHPFSVFLLRQFMKMIPESYLESARVDGAGPLRIFFLIILPMVKAGLAASFMLTWIDYWNLIDQAIIFIRSGEAQPLSLFLARLNKEKLGVAFAASCVYSCPVILMFLYGQEYLEDGISLSGVKF